MSASAGATVDLWQALATAQPPTRGAVLLVALGAEQTWTQACAQPLSRCADVALAELRRRAGDTMDTVVTCASCGALLDVQLDLSDLADLPAPARVDLGDVVVRAPTTGDLVLAGQAADPVAALRALCVDGADRSLGEGWRGTVEGAVEQVCGAAAVAIRAECAQCSAPLAAEVDLVELLTARVTDEASAILRTVAEIAAAFGWPESDILALPPVRREHYLGLARGLRGGHE